MMTDIVSNTKTPPIINNKSSFFSNIASVPRAAPVDKDPVSPIKISAGEELNQRNPRKSYFCK